MQGSGVELTKEELHYWGIAGQPGHPELHKALNFWARNQSRLIGPISFTVPPGELLLGKWQRIVSKSSPFCNCGEKRRMLPARSYKRFIGGEEPVIVKPGKQVAIGIWGGDREDVQVQIEVSDGQFITRALPYVNVPRDTLAALGLAAIHVDSLNDTPTSGLLRADAVPIALADYAQKLEEDNRPIELAMSYPLASRSKPLTTSDMAKVIKVRNALDRDYVTCTVYAVKAVDLENSAVQVLVSSNFKVFDLTMPGQFHTCQPTVR